LSPTERKDETSPKREARAALSFAICVSDDAIARANIKNSPCLRQPSPHQIIAIEKSPSAASGLNAALKRAKHEWVVCVHQDVYLSVVRCPLSVVGGGNAPGDWGAAASSWLAWDVALLQQLRVAEERFGRIGVAGVYGVGDVIGDGSPGNPLAAQRIGWVVDRGRELRDGPELPSQVSTLDELLLVVRREAGLCFDPALGFHLYGADLCLQARERGLSVVALAAPCHHNSRSIGLPEAFCRSAEVFARKWSQRLPVATPCVIIDRGGGVRLLDDAGEDSIAYAGISEPLIDRAADAL
jgi:hypothetical protein